MFFSAFICTGTGISHPHSMFVRQAGRTHFFRIPSIGMAGFTGE